MLFTATKQRTCQSNKWTDPKPGKRALPRFYQAESAVTQNAGVGKDAQIEHHHSRLEGSSSTWFVFLLVIDLLDAECRHNHTLNPGNELLKATLLRAFYGLRQLRPLHGAEAPASCTRTNCRVHGFGLLPIIGHLRRDDPNDRLRRPFATPALLQALDGRRRHIGSSYSTSPWTSSQRRTASARLPLALAYR